MIFYLLFAALVFGCGASGSDGIVDLQTNLTERNQTSTNDNCTTKPNVTSTWYEDQKPRIEDDLEGNQTSALITEDDERFQEDEFQISGGQCYQKLLVPLSHFYCGEAFHQEMEAVSPDEWCILKNVIRPYNDLTVCLENITHTLRCYFPNPDIQDFFLFIHSIYFHNCSEGGGAVEFLEDAPHSLVVVLTIVPVVFVPVLVYLVVWKSKA